MSISSFHAWRGQRKNDDGQLGKQVREVIGSYNDGDDAFSVSPLLVDSTSHHRSKVSNHGGSNF